MAGQFPEPHLCGGAAHCGHLLCGYGQLLLQHDAGRAENPGRPRQRIFLQQRRNQFPGVLPVGQQLCQRVLRAGHHGAAVHQLLRQDHGQLLRPYRRNGPGDAGHHQRLPDKKNGALPGGGPPHRGTHHVCVRPPAAGRSGGGRHAVCHLHVRRDPGAAHHRGRGSGTADCGRGDGVRVQYGVHQQRGGTGSGGDGDRQTHCRRQLRHPDGEPLPGRDRPAHRRHQQHVGPDQQEREGEIGVHLLRLPRAAHAPYRHQRLGGDPAGGRRPAAAPAGREHHSEGVPPSDQHGGGASGLLQDAGRTVYPEH